MALTTASKTQLDAALVTLNNQRLTIPGFVVSILRHSSFSQHPAVLDLLDHSTDVLDAFLGHPQTFQSTLAWANGIVKARYTQDIRDLADKDSGWHFSAANTSAKQLETFRIEDMAAKMKTMAPELWDLFGLLLTANRRAADDVLDTMDTDSPEEESLTRGAQAAAERREALVVIKKVVMMSVLMQSTNSKSNALQSVFGIFLHASNTSAKVIETLAHMGISISPDAIDNAVRSLSRETYETLRATTARKRSVPSSRAPSSPR
ncbi:hypothetical protein C8R47DRAFT_990556 [Mycena vitilis]|nr:hypothetical protein C8R47DRAFT_990556 [Mycena vitilis]